LGRKEEEEKQNGVTFGILDCSNDELVERAMEALLEEKFPQATSNKSVLVADEFHMLSEEHKRELFDWVTDKLSWLKVILIGNRSNGAPLLFFLLFL